jgi:hypothetical protein
LKILSLFHLQRKDAHYTTLIYQYQYLSF